MMKEICKNFILILCFVFLAFSSPGAIYAIGEWQTGCGTTLSEPPTIQEIGCVFVRLINVVMSLSAGVGILGLIISGIRFYTAQGDPKGIAQAKLTLTFAILGFILAIGSYAVIVLIGRLLGIILIPGFIIPS